jgi:hypothetical protein
MVTAAVCKQKSLSIQTVCIIRMDEPFTKVVKFRTSWTSMVHSPGWARVLSHIENALCIFFLLLDNKEMTCIKCLLLDL